MFSGLITLASRFLRSTGQTLDKLGRKFELNPYVEKCKFAMHNIMTDMLACPFRLLNIYFDSSNTLLKILNKITIHKQEHLIQKPVD